MRARAMGLVALAFVTVLSPNATGQALRQTDWSAGPGRHDTSLLDAEDGFDSSGDHVLYDAVPGALRFVPLIYQQDGQVHEVAPVRGAVAPEDYYAAVAEGNAYPEPTCRKSWFWLFRDLRHGDLSWMYLVNRRDPEAQACWGSQAASFGITSPEPAELLLVDDAGTQESSLRGLQHEWSDTEVDGHVVALGSQLFKLSGHLGAAEQLAEHAFVLDEGGAAVVTPGEDLPRPFYVAGALQSWLLSALFDAGEARDWGAVRLQTSALPGARVQVYLRAGETPEDALRQAFVGPLRDGEDASHPALSGRPDQQ